VCFQAAIQEDEDPALSEEGQGTQNYKGCRESVMYHIRMCGLAVCGCVGVWCGGVVIFNKSDFKCDCRTGQGGDIS
jgi:hypothetical protein